MESLTCHATHLRRFQALTDGRRSMESDGTGVVLVGVTQQETRALEEERRGEENVVLFVPCLA